MLYIQGCLTSFPTQCYGDEELWDDLEDLDPMMSAVSTSCPTCQPAVYDAKLSGKDFQPKKIYNLYTGNAPGIYTTWDDVAGRVIGVSESRYKSYKSYDEALHGWKQHCLSHHRHGPDFVDGTTFTPPLTTRNNIQPVTLPPYLNTIPLPHLDLPSPSQPLVRQSPSKRRSAQAFFGPGSPARRRTNQVPERGLSWAVTTGGKTAIVDFETADEIVREAHL
ncbi:hypothetical protein D9758_003353 [Tetrapyrgos nigripes]|uniref:Ribonuclease H1 N-terminal domain-containing protein n=1 Tax=Tetrapyrgos nigripes TaxID=182062 RepID=A0A8H5GV12_9AGAR|nr:hypothetical protein D9758_003353 [Tetrapyrgos nigripes]